MSKTLLVLGAGVYQVPTIETGLRLGYRVITTDNVPGNPGHVLADAAFNIDTTDVPGVLDLAGCERISGVIAPGTDVAVLTAAHVSEHLHLPGPPVSAACVLTQKFRFREFLRQSGFDSPRAFLVEQGRVPPEALFDGRAWLVKPNRSSGSKGIFVLSKREEFLAHVAESQRFSSDGTAVLEEFMDGTQHTCEGVLKQGRVAVALVTDRETAPMPYTATTGHRVPSRLTEAVQDSTLRLIERAFDRLGVTSGPFDCDFLVDSDGIALIEMTPRLGGNSLSKLSKAALDFDLVAYAVRRACGDPYELPNFRQPKPRSIAILGVEGRGRLTWNEIEMHALRREAWVESLILDLPQGSPVKPFINGRRRVGEALIAGSDRNELDIRAEELRRRLALAAA
jgi:biotin carboxylase